MNAMADTQVHPQVKLKIPIMPLSSALPRVFMAGLACGLLLCASIAAAQSGRRGTKPPPISNPTPEPTPTPGTPAKNEQPELTLIVGIDKNSSFSGTATFYYDTVLRACVERLDDVRTVKVDVTQRDMGRGDAVRRAKSEHEAYVVWLQLLPDTTGVSNRSASNNDEFYIEFWIFTPQTAALKGSGRTYARAYGRKGGVVVGPPTGGRTSPMYTEYLLKEAARDAAEEILKKFHISSRSDPIPH